jgi:hypothetical protein
MGHASSSVDGFCTKPQMDQPSVMLLCTEEVTATRTLFISTQIWPQRLCRKRSRLPNWNITQQTRFGGIQRVHFLKRILPFASEVCPSHFSRQVHNWLNNRLLDTWIGRGNPTAWPSRSPDLNTRHLFLWVCIKVFILRKNMIVTTWPDEIW